MQRYFASLLDTEHVQLTKDDEHHLLHVMRMKKDDEIEAVADNKLYLCKIKSVNPLDIYIVHEKSRVLILLIFILFTNLKVMWNYQWMSLYYLLSPKVIKSI